MSSPSTTKDLCFALLDRQHAREGVASCGMAKVEQMGIVVQALRSCGFLVSHQTCRLDVGSAIAYLSQAMVIDGEIIGFHKELGWEAINQSIFDNLPATFRKNQWSAEAPVSVLEATMFKDMTAFVRGIFDELVLLDAAFIQAYKLDHDTNPAPHLRPSPRL